MADQEKTEQATPRRRQESRRKGQVARSQEVAGAVSLLAGLLALRAFGPWMWEHFRAITENAWLQPTISEVTVGEVMRLLTPLFANAAIAVLPIMACCCLAALTANLLQSGFLYSLQPVTPDFSRINPINGARRILSLRGFGELIKALLKLTLLTSVAFFYLRGRLPDLAMLAATHGLSALGEVAATIWGLVLRMGIVMAIIAAADYLFQRRMHEQNLRMSKHELKEEFRRHEGDPQLKAQLRRRQQEIARGRMLHNVSKATVVVTNPVHVAVALRYEPDEMPAPVLVAKGQRRMAERIRDEARRHRVPILERAPLARALFKAVEIGDPIPTALYQAVAEIIAFVYRLSGRHHTADQR